MLYQKIREWLTGRKGFNALTLLKADHDKVKELLKKANKTTKKEAAQRKKLFHDIKHELKVHTKLEETLFYPKLKDFPALIVPSRLNRCRWSESARPHSPDKS